LILGALACGSVSPMRLVGFRFEQADGPASTGYVPLGQLTAVLGANDAGKSRLLATLASALREPPTIGARFYVELAPEEIPRMLRVACRELSAEDNVSEAPRGALSQSLSVHEFWGKSDEEVLRWTLSRIESAPRDDRPGWLALCSGLARSSIFAFETAGLGDPGSWNVAWCLPTSSTLDVRLQRALDGLRIADANARRGPHFVTRLTRDRSLLPWAEASALEPYPMAPLGDVPVSWLPLPISFPTTDAELATTAVHVISELLRELGWHDLIHEPVSALVAGSRDVEFISMIGVMPDADEARQVPSDATRQSWLERPDASTVRLAPDVAAARAFIERYANSVAPAAIREAYDLKTEISPDAVLTDSPIAFRLGRRGADPAGPLSSFGTKDAADGHRIWIQLAFAEGTAALRDLAARLSGLAASVWDAIQGLAEREIDFEDGYYLERHRELEGSSTAIDEYETAGLAEEAQQAIEHARMRLIAAARPYLDLVADFRAQIPTDPWASVRESGRAGLVEVRAPLYLVDEPERHLHPLSQGKFAAWMRDLVRVRGAQGALVTHAVPFVNKADTLAYMRRDGPGSSVRSCSPDELGTLGEIATELGLDRGQLLAGIAVILFVEGPSDQHVFEGLFGDRLREIGAAVVPLHGATKLAQVVDSQLLLRYTNAKIVTLLDNTTKDEIQALTTNAEYRQSALRSPKAERQALARLIAEVLAQHREVTPLGLRAEDIFFLLDAESIRDTFRQIRDRNDAQPTNSRTASVEDYPGHDRFWTEYQKAPHKNEKWKAFCNRAYGIDFHGDVRWFRDVAETMRAREQFPPELVDVVDQLEILSL
jgi:energy-coupling factor transporter ATP-binding protein EcfA2